MPVVFPRRPTVLSQVLPAPSRRVRVTRRVRVARPKPATQPPVVEKPIFPLASPASESPPRSVRDAMFRMARVSNLYRKKDIVLEHRKSLDLYTGSSVAETPECRYQVDHVIEIQLVLRCLFALCVSLETPGVVYVMAVIRASLNQVDNLNVTTATINTSKGRAIHMFTTEGAWMGKPLGEIAAGYKAEPYIPSIVNAMRQSYVSVRAMLLEHHPPALPESHRVPAAISLLRTLVDTLDGVLDHAYGASCV